MITERRKRTLLSSTRSTLGLMPSESTPSPSWMIIDMSESCVMLSTASESCSPACAPLHSHPSTIRIAIASSAAVGGLYRLATKLSDSFMPMTFETSFVSVTSAISCTGSLLSPWSDSHAFRRRTTSSTETFESSRSRNARLTLDVGSVRMLKASAPSWAIRTLWPTFSRRIFIRRTLIGLSSATRTTRSRDLEDFWCIDLLTACLAFVLPFLSPELASFLLSPSLMTTSSTGRVNDTTVPTPAVLSMYRAPPQASMNVLQMCRPSPEPPPFAVLVRTYGLHAFITSTGLIPLPLSDTAK
mmetsp:Transcript_11989/g.19343  ORF Transcript_11989/g.19343 Transcript_11989/m.19343 type:complete len:300 (-) Transcript_11989:2204-3103(-)